MEEGISRRGFIGGFATAAATVAVAAASGCSPAPTASEAVAVEDEKKTVNAEAKNGEMTDEEALAALQDEAEVTEDLVLEDGTIIPAIYVRMRNRSNRLGAGLGSEIDLSANFWGFVTRAFSEEEAEYYLDMPLVKNFTATEMSEKSGREEAKCLEICEELASRGLIYRTRRAGVPFFRLIPQINGMWEYSINEWKHDEDYDVDYLNAHWGQYGGMRVEGVMDSDIPPYFRSMPVSTDVIGDEKVIPAFADFEKVIRNNTVIARGDCVCRANGRAFGKEDEHPKETEILTGECAEYYIENGIGWPITQDEALEVLHDAVDRGLVIQATFSKASEIFCCCAGDCCKMLGTIKAAGGGVAMKYYSHYLLGFDEDSCLKCGKCVERCHLEAITMGEDGHPQTGDTCVRCGQCAVTCPGEARKLYQMEDFPELPDALVDTDLHKAMTRMKRGYIQDYVPGA